MHWTNDHSCTGGPNNVLRFGSEQTSSCFGESVGHREVGVYDAAKYRQQDNTKNRTQRNRTSSPAKALISFRTGVITTLPFLRQPVDQVLVPLLIQLHLQRYHRRRCCQ